MDKKFVRSADDIGRFPDDHPNRVEQIAAMCGTIHPDKGLRSFSAI